MERTKGEQRFQQLVDIFTGTGELQYYDTKSHSLFLRNMPTYSTDLMNLRRRIQTITEKFKLVVTEPLQLYSNMQILNVEVKPKRSGNNKDEWDYHLNRRLKRLNRQRPSDRRRQDC